MFHWERGISRSAPLTRSRIECPWLIHSVSVKTLNIEPVWKPLPPPRLRVTLRLMSVASGSVSDGWP
jgi:hypothetical protein